MKIMKVYPSNIYMFRAPMTCPNIVYSVLEYNTKVKETDTICRLVQEKLEQYTAPAKIIVYSSTITRTKELSEVLGYYKYYREVRDQAEKEEIMERWQRADSRLIVATNVFGLGIDAPDVRVMIYTRDIY